ncbi:MAG: GBS Bsp-like repeat-containing protein [Lachnospiraceae bacterium]|nr:GBS Bsp-like repeat-containing protein [Lachnospiraceae bacterium]
MFRRRIAVLLSAVMTVTAAVPSPVFAGEEPNAAEPVQLLEEASDETGFGLAEAVDNELGDVAEDLSAAGGTEQVEEDFQQSSSGSENGFQESTEQEDTLEQPTETLEPELEAVESDKEISEVLETEEDQKAEPEREEPVVKAVLDPEEKTMTVSVTGVDPEAEAVVFPVWSAKDGQDDIEWAAARKHEDGSWKAVITMKKHSGLGEYYIHCYETVKGEMRFAGHDKAVLSAPVASVEIQDLQAEKGTFTVVVKDLVVPSGVSRVEIPVWGAVNGQNDLVWYQAVREGEEYVAKVDAARHSYENGLYYVHAYVTDGNGNRAYVQKATAELDLQMGVSAELTEDERTIKVTARGIDASATAVTIPVWSGKNGQDDLKWITAVKSTAGVWKADIPVKGHKDPGLYYIHCYQTVKGKQTFFGSAKVTVTAPSGVVAADTPDENTGAFAVSVSELNVPAGVKSVQFAVWGDEGGQNDLVWHSAVKQGDRYVSTISAGDHKFETGLYHVHCYVTDQNDIMAFAGNTTATVTLKEGVTAVVSADQMTAKIQYIGPKAGQSLKVAVWSQEKGQDDLIWYSMKQNSNGATASVKLSSHKTAGLYFAHVYTQDNRFVGNTTFTVDALGKASVAVSAVDGRKGTFKVTVSGLSTPSGLEKVLIPVWPEGDQGRINWYTATKSGDSYVCTVNVTNHKRTFGHYDVHVYGYANNGISGFVGASSAELKADCYMYTEKTGTYSTRVWMLNAGAADSVIFRAWSDANGTDDLVNYTGVKSGSNYYADIQSKKHKNGGNYTTEGYLRIGGNDTKVGTVTYSMAKEGEAKNQQMYQYAQGFSSDTNYLILVNRALHRVAIYQGSKNNWKEIKYWPCVVGKPSTPTPTGTFKIKGRFDWFGSDHKCWWATQIEGYYYFHTVLYYWDDAPKRILDGTMDAAASMGCIRLEEPNARWIYTTIPRGTTVHIYN